MYVSEWSSNRVTEWKSRAATGQVVAGGNQCGNSANQLCNPRDVIVDKSTDSLIMCDRSNRRVVRWPRQNGTSGETIISNIDCWGLTMDSNGYLYVTDDQNNQVRQYQRGESQGTVVAGGNGGGSLLNQLLGPSYVFVDENQVVYVCDSGNHRVMKWTKGATQGIVVAGGSGQGNGLTQLSNPEGIVADQSGTVYIADASNGRIMRWINGATQGNIIIGGNGIGGQSNQLSQPIGLSFDLIGNLYVSELGNKRVQKFTLNSNN